jgi:hypothetical protein
MTNNQPHTKLKQQLGHFFYHNFNKLGRSEGTRPDWVLYGPFIDRHTHDMMVCEG